MITVTKRELNQNTAAVLAQAQEQVTGVVILERGVPKWQIIPLETGTPISSLALLEAQGLATRANPNPVPWDELPDTLPYKTETEMIEMLDWVRGERF